MFLIGMLGVITQKNMIRILMSVEIMINSANINFALFTYLNPNGNLLGWVGIMFAIALAAAEATIGLAIIVAIYRSYGSSDITETISLGEDKNE